VDPITLEILHNRLLSIAEEMRATLVRSGYSINIKERQDCSTAIFNAAGDVVAMPSQATVPIHLSSLDGVVHAVRERYEEDQLIRGDMFLANDPYIAGGGSSHLPDYTLVAPVIGEDDRLVAFVANLAHHSDIGGAAAGSHAVHMPSIFHEGLRLPVMRAVKGGKIDEDIMALIQLNSRLPEEREGDMLAQIASNVTGVRGIEELTTQYGEASLEQGMTAILDYGERRLRRRLLDLPDGRYEASDFFDHDGIGEEPLPIHVLVDKQGDRLLVDFTGTSPQVSTALNVPMIATRATVLCVVKTMLDPELPPNGGVNRPIRITAPKGTLVNASSPAAVGERAVTCQVIADALARALADLVPGEGVSGCGSLLAYRVCGTDPRKGRYFVEYQAFAGGHGATAYGDGMDCVRVWASGATNAPVEADEMGFPMIVHHYGLREDSGGAGRNKGGRGLIRRFEILADDAILSTSGTRLRIPPPGLMGGKPGAPATITINPETPREVRLSGMVTDYRLCRGDIIEIETAGGGGWGRSDEGAEAASSNSVSDVHSRFPVPN
jgi:N-methylhydantoinase B